MIQSIIVIYINNSLNTFINEVGLYNTMQPDMLQPAVAGPKRDL